MYAAYLLELAAKRAPPGYMYMYVAEAEAQRVRERHEQLGYNLRCFQPGGGLRV